MLPSHPCSGSWQNDVRWVWAFRDSCTWTPNRPNPPRINGRYWNILQLWTLHKLTWVLISFTLRWYGLKSLHNLLATYIQPPPKLRENLKNHHSDHGAEQVLTIRLPNLQPFEQQTVFLLVPTDNDILSNPNRSTINRASRESPWGLWPTSSAHIEVAKTKVLASVSSQSVKPFSMPMAGNHHP